MLQKNPPSDLRFGLELYLSFIEREFERRPFDISTADWFRWPSTDAPEGQTSMTGAQFMPEGMLSVLGYRVGLRQGLRDADRHCLLDQIFERVLPPLFPRSYMDKWGKGGTAVRLRTLSYTIAQLTKNLKHKRDNRMHRAISEYESDLTYLYDRYYVDKFRFGWPSTAI